MRGESREIGNESDAKLLALARRGDEEAFVTLFRRHQSPVFRFAMHMCGRKECAEEVTQEVFLQLLSDDAKFREVNGELQAFLIGVTRNQVRKQLRQSRAMPGSATGAELAALPEAYERVRKEQDAAALRAAILSLPIAYREAVVLCELEGMDLAEAAQRLGCALGTVKSRLNRARSILRAKLYPRERCSV